MEIILKYASLDIDELNERRICKHYNIKCGS